MPKVTDPRLLGQLNAPGQMVAPNPLFPGQMQGQSLNNTGQGLTNERTAAELPYVAPKAAANAREAQVNANVATATAPAEIAQKNASARQSAAQATTTENNLATTGGANEGQAKSASFYTRALRSNGIYDKSGIKDQPWSHSLAQTLLPDALVNEFTSPERQQAEAAQRDFISATLRYESGAAIPPSEFEAQRKIFFPSAGDDPSTVAVKAQLRQNAIDGLKLASGPAAPMLEQGGVPQAGRTDYSNMVGGPQTGVATTGLTDIAKPVFRSEFDPDTSAAVDQLIRTGRPVNEIAAFAQSRGYQMTPDVMKTIAQAKLYMKQNPKYKAGFTQATTMKPLSLREKISGSPLGAIGSAMGTATTAGFNDELAGVLNAAQGGNYAEGRDAFNAKKQLVSDAHPYADFAGTALGSALTMGALGVGGKAAGVPDMLAPTARYGQSAADVANIGARRASVLGDLAYGTAYGAGENNDNRLLGSAEGGAAALGGNLAGRAGANTLGALVSPTGGKLASLYALGVRPSIGQRAGGLVNNFEEKLKSIPILGDAIEGTRDRARNQFQIGLFNDSLGEIGTQLPKGMKPGHDPHAFAQSAFNHAYDSAKMNMTAAADAGLSTDLGSVQRTLSTLKPDSQNTFNKVWADSVGRRFAGGSLSGAAFKDATSEIEKKIAAIRNSKTGDGELADVLQEATNALRASAMRNSPPQAVAAMDAVDRGYAKLVRIEDASKRAGGEAATFSPAQYNSAVKDTSGGVRKRSYLAGNALNTDIASAGLNLQDVVSNSGTIDRLLPATALMGTGFLSPKAAAVMASFGLLNAPGLRNLTTAALAPRQSKKVRKLADLVRKQATLAGTVGSGVGVGLLPSQ